MFAQLKEKDGMDGDCKIGCILFCLFGAGVFI